MPDDTLRFAWNDLDLVGTLRLPDHGGQHPVVVMLQGSGPAAIWRCSLIELSTESLISFDVTSTEGAYDDR
jgi:hypothetical protein